MAKVFLSHNSAQKALVEQVAAKVGLDNIFMDEFNFNAGNLLTDEIKRAINASSIFVLFLSDEAQKAPWVGYEVDYITKRILSNSIKFVPIIVDEKFSHNSLCKDWEWMKQYLLKPFNSPYLIAHIIKEKLQDINSDEHSLSYARRVTFVGRDDEMREIQAAYSQTMFTSRRALIVAGMPHVGRKRLLKEVLIQKLEANLPKTYEPISLSLSRDDQIENFIDQLNDILHPCNIIEKIAVDKKNQLDLAIELLCEMDDFNRKILIEDSSCIVLPDGHISDWFMDILQSPKLQNRTYFLIASRYAVSSRTITTNTFVQYHQIGTLQSSAMVTLFNKYAQQRGVVTAELTSESDWFTSQFTGYPEQALNIIDEIAKTDLYRAKLYFSGYLQIYKNDFADVINEVEKNPETLQLLILLSRFEFISVEFLYQIVGPHLWEQNNLEQLAALCVYETFGGMHQYIRLNPALSNYIRKRRDTLILSNEIEIQLSRITHKIIDNIDNDSLDLSTRLYAIKESIKENPKDVADKYLLPSYALKVIIEEYQHEHYDNVITIANRVLYEYKRDCYDSITYPIRHWLCMAYCHQNDKRLQDELQYFNKNSNTYHYILGFNARLRGNYPLAQKHLEMAVGDYLNSPKRAMAKSAHELVLVYMLQNNFDKALYLAKQNYEIDRTNAYQIEAYFRCLVNTNKATADILSSLINDMERSYDSRKDFYVDNFKVEYEFYIKSNFTGAMTMFEKICVKYGEDYRKYTHQAVLNICKNINKLDKYNELFKQFPNF